MVDYPKGKIQHMSSIHIDSIKEIKIKEVETGSATEVVEITIHLKDDVSILFTWEEFKQKKYFGALDNWITMNKGVIPFRIACLIRFKSGADFHIHGQDAWARIKKHYHFDSGSAVTMPNPVSNTIYNPTFPVNAFKSDGNFSDWLKKFTDSIVAKTKPEPDKNFEEWKEELLETLEIYEKAILMKLTKKDIVYRAWMKDKFLTPVELNALVGNCLQISTIQRWLTSWAQGKRIPRQSAEEELKSLKERLRSSNSSKEFDDLYKQHVDLVGEHSRISRELDKQQKKMEEMENELKSLRKNKNKFKGEIVLVKPDGKKKRVKGARHPAYHDMIQLASLRKNIFLPGPAGCGKSHLAEQVAEDLELDYYFINCSSGMSEGHLTGRLLPVGKNGQFEFVTAGFAQAFEFGGLFCGDELDAADPNVLLVINTAISNGVLTLPNRIDDPVIERHPDFVFVACANTYGRGADRLYVGRNNLDEATLDRFRIGTIPMNYDDGIDDPDSQWTYKCPMPSSHFVQLLKEKGEGIEDTLCPNDELRTRLQWYRYQAQRSRLERIVSTRFMIDAYDMKTCCEWSDEKIDRCLFSGWSIDEIKLMGVVA